LNIAIIGNSHFGPIITRQLNDYDSNNLYKYYNTNGNKLDVIKFILHIFSIDIVYSISGSISAGGALNLALLFKKRIIQHFIGSDVLSALEDYKNNNISSKLIKNSTYLCEVNWIQEELKTIGIQAKIAPIMVYEKNITPKQFDNFSVLTYMSKGREDFYGMDTLIVLAKALPDVTFKIAGISDCNQSVPKNIFFLGWINMLEELQQSTCYIRNAKHDGLAISVLEALSLGRVVFYNNQFPYVNYFQSDRDLIAKIKTVKDDFDNGMLLVNKKAIDLVKKEFRKENVLNNLISIFTGKKVDL